MCATPSCVCGSSEAVGEIGIYCALRLELATSPTCLLQHRGPLAVTHLLPVPRLTKCCANWCHCEPKKQQVAAVLSRHPLQGDKVRLVKAFTEPCPAHPCADTPSCLVQHAAVSPLQKSAEVCPRPMCVVRRCMQTQCTSACLRTHTGWTNRLCAPPHCHPSTGPCVALIQRVTSEWQSHQTHS